MGKTGFRGKFFREFTSIVHGYVITTKCLIKLDNLSTGWEQAMRTHLADKLLEQHCKSAAGLLAVVFTCAWSANFFLHVFIYVCV